MVLNFEEFITALVIANAQICLTNIFWMFNFFLDPFELIVSLIFYKIYYIVTLVDAI